MKRYWILSFLILCSAQSWSVTETITVREFNEAINDALASGSDLGNLIGERVQRVLEEADIRLDEDSLVYSYYDGSNMTLRKKCSAKVKLRKRYATVVVDGDSKFSFVVDSLKDPIIVSTDVHASVDATGKLTARYGKKRFGRCFKYQKDNFSVHVDADVSLFLKMAIHLNPEFVNGNTIILTPEIKLSGGVRSVTEEDVDIKDFEWVGSYLAGGMLGSLVGVVVPPAGSYIMQDELIRYAEQYSEGQLNTQNANNFLAQFLVEQERALNEQLRESLEGPTREYSLPGALTFDHVAGLANIINSELFGRFPVAVDYVEDHAEEILFYLITGDSEALQTLIATAAACEASQYAQRNLKSTPLYHLSESSCVVADKYSYDGQYYLDNQCTNTTDFQPTSYAEYCAQVIDKEYVGNAAAWRNSENNGVLPWTLTPISRFDIGVASIKSNYQPFVKQLIYRSVNVFKVRSFFGRERITPRGSGTCELEMRVYKRDLADHPAVSLRHWPEPLGPDRAPMSCGNDFSPTG